MSRKFIGENIYVTDVIAYKMSEIKRKCECGDFRENVASIRES